MRTCYSRRKHLKSTVFTSCSGNNTNTCYSSPVINTEVLRFHVTVNTVQQLQRNETRERVAVWLYEKRERSASITSMMMLLSENKITWNDQWESSIPESSVIIMFIAAHEASGAEMKKELHFTAHALSGWPITTAWAISWPIRAVRWIRCCLPLKASACSSPTMPYLSSVVDARSLGFGQTVCESRCCSGSHSSVRSCRWRCNASV